MNIDLKKFLINTLNNELKISKFNEIQNRTIPLQLKNKNVIGVSSTGSGKTLAFLLPILNKIKLNNDLQSIIITPTRELARQIYNVSISFKKYEPNLKIDLFIGGNEYEKQVNKINKYQPQIIIATVDRLKKSIINKEINFSNIFNITIDEADMMSDLGFINDLDFILNKLNDHQIQITSWSATLHDLLIDKLKKIIKNPYIVKVGNSIYENKNINHLIIMNDDWKQSLNILINKINPYLCIIFANTKQKVEEIYKFLKNNNLNVIMLHANLSSRERKNIYKEISSFNYQYVVASDLASRGIDINGVSDVISIDLPNDIEWYIHRAGRTGRGKYCGNSWILINNKKNNLIDSLIKKKIKFNFYMIKNNSLLPFKYIQAKNYNNIDEIAKKEIIISKTKTKQKVKPNYKKKQKEKINKIKQKSKRRYIDAKIKSIINKKQDN